jgi:hypothetical protein
MKTDEEIKGCIRKQKELCDNSPNYKGWHFAPYDGVCYDCRKNIYQDYGERKGWSGDAHVTGCPHCNRSYCD